MIFYYCSLASTLLTALGAIAILGAIPQRLELKLFSFLLYFAALYDIFISVYANIYGSTAGLILPYTVIEFFITSVLLYQLHQGEPRRKVVTIVAIAYYVFGILNLALEMDQPYWILEHYQMRPLAALCITFSALITFQGLPIQDKRYSEQDYRIWLLLGLVIYHLIGGVLVYSLAHYDAHPDYFDTYKIHGTVTVIHNIAFAIAIWLASKCLPVETAKNRWVSNVTN